MVATVAVEAAPVAPPQEIAPAAVVPAVMGIDKAKEGSESVSVLIVVKSLDGPSLLVEYTNPQGETVQKFSDGSKKVLAKK